MQRVASRGEADDLIRFRRLLNATILATFALIVLGVIAALAFVAFRRLRDHHWLTRGTVVAAVLVLAQAALGGLTVEHGLHSALVAAHLGLAMLLLGLLIALHRIARPDEVAP